MWATKNKNMNIISVREQPQYAERIIAYLQKNWSEVSPIIYSDCVSHCIDAANPLPQWYVLDLKTYTCVPTILDIMRNMVSNISEMVIIRGRSNHEFMR